MTSTTYPLKLPVFSSRNTPKTVFSEYSTSPENEDIVKNVLRLSTHPHEAFFIPSKKTQSRAIQYERDKFMRRYFKKELELVSTSLKECVSLMKEGGVVCKFVVCDYMLDINKVEDTIIAYFRYLGYSITSKRTNNEIDVVIDWV